LIDVVTPAELPVIISAARSQQFRWNKGGAENFRKMNWRVTSKNISVKQKFMVYCIYSIVQCFYLYFLMAVLSVPVVFIKK
jgi:hypothetical protein